MKLFSRKALVAGATSLAVLAGGMTAPAIAQEATAAVELQADSKTGTTNSQGMTNDKKDKGSSDPKEIREWIGVVTAVLGVVSTLVTILANTQLRNLLKH